MAPMRCVAGFAVRFTGCRNEQKGQGILRTGTYTYAIGVRPVHSLFTLSYDAPFLIYFVQKLAAVLGYEYQVLNADTVFSFQIDTRLDGEDHARLSHVPC